MRNLTNKISTFHFWFYSHSQRLLVHCECLFIVSLTDLGDGEGGGEGGE
jgi:hypothetical protein